MSSTLRSAFAWLLLTLIVLSLIPVGLVVASLTALNDPERIAVRRLVARWVSIYGWTSPLYRIRIEGGHNLPARGAYVMVANHESGLDALALMMTGSPVCFLADSWMFRAWWCGWAMRLMRHIPVRRGDRESGHLALQDGEARLRAGSPIAVFPEGAYAAPGEVLEFRPGAFVAAKRAGVPIVPVRLLGTGAAWAPGTVVVEGKNDIQIRILPPVAPERIADAEPDPLRDEVRRAIIDAGRA